MTKEQFFKVATPFRLILLVAVISIIANLSFFGSQWLKADRQKSLDAGAIQLREQIFNIVTQQGGVIIGNTAGQQVKLQVVQ